MDFASTGPTLSMEPSSLAIARQLMKDQLVISSNIVDPAPAIMGLLALTRLMVSGN